MGAPRPGEGDSGGGDDREEWEQDDEVLGVEGADGEATGDKDDDDGEEAEVHPAQPRGAEVQEEIGGGEGEEERGVVVVGRCAGPGEPASLDDGGQGVELSPEVGEEGGVADAVGGLVEAGEYGAEGEPAGEQVEEQEGTGTEGEREQAEREVAEAESAEEGAQADEEADGEGGEEPEEEDLGGESDAEEEAGGVEPSGAVAAIPAVEADEGAGGEGDDDEGDVEAVAAGQPEAGGGGQEEGGDPGGAGDEHAAGPEEDEDEPGEAAGEFVEADGVGSDAEGVEEGDHQVGGGGADVVADHEGEVERTGKEGIGPAAGALDEVHGGGGVEGFVLVETGEVDLPEGQEAEEEHGEGEPEEVDPVGGAAGGGGLGRGGLARERLFHYRGKPFCGEMAKTAARAKPAESRRGGGACDEPGLPSRRAGRCLAFQEPMLPESRRFVNAGRGAAGRWRDG